MIHKALAVVFTLCSPSFAFDGQPLHYEIDWGPVTLADATIQLLESGDVRSVKADIASRGVGAWFSDFQSTLEILRTGDGVQVLNGESTWGETLSNITVLWQPLDPNPTVDFYRSRPRDYELTPIPEESIANTIDPFTPVFEIGRKLDETGHCEGSYRIFDGVRRYDLAIKDGGPVTLQAEEPENFSGQSYRCDITVARIGGFSAKKGWFRFGDSEITRTLYLGNIRGHWLPVRFEISAPLGTAVARLMVGSRTVASQ